MTLRERVERIMQDPQVALVYDQKLRLLARRQQPPNARTAIIVFLK